MFSTFPQPKRNMHDTESHNREVHITTTTNMPLVVEYPPRTLRMHQVTEAELDSVASLGNSIHLTFLGMSFGAFVALAIVLFSIEIADPLKYASVVGLTWISGIATLYFGARAIIDHRASRAKISEIKRGGLGPKF